MRSAAIKSNTLPCTVGTSVRNKRDVTSMVESFLMTYDYAYTK